MWKIWDELLEVPRDERAQNLCAADEYLQGDLKDVFKMIVFANTKRRIEHLQKQVPSPCLSSDTGPGAC